MKLRFLGTGTSTGNPEIGCRCGVCTSSDRRDRRFRASVLIETKGKRILIDCSPDFRMQMLETQKTASFLHLDGVLLTHEHYDHVGGLDDLRAFCREGAVEIYAEAPVAKAIRTRIPYVFRKRKYPGVPDLDLHIIENKPFYVSGIEIMPIRLMHAKLPIFGFRIGNLAYLTDLKTIPKEEYWKLQNIDVLVINALRPKEHISHQNLPEALEQIRKINPRRAYLTHISHHFGLHAVVEKTLPPNVSIAFDKEEVQVIPENGK
ncbi:MAG: MBL fold metallo-hydrolase [Dysgonamonadaceae bacterium]|jgi:phosphoribosyl 1,2-cyclic phosphate phosphodiesterase|nr:MBL fold metallo-hydrolase [Dysgonamonadaceae bacterium]